MIRDLTHRAAGRIIVGTAQVNKGREAGNVICYGPMVSNGRFFTHVKLQPVMHNFVAQLCGKFRLKAFNPV